MSKNLPRSQYDSSQPEAPMEQVREILFGAQLKDMEMRFRRQEERLLREITDVKDTLRKRLDSLENFMKSEVSSLLGRMKDEQNEREAIIKTEQRERQDALKNEARERNELLQAERRELHDNIAKEQRDRGEAIAKLTSDLALNAENFERRSTKISATLDSTEREIRELMMTEHTGINDKIDEKYNEVLSIINKTASQIRSDMVYRTALSTMLTETVAALSHPWNLDSSAVDVSDENQLLEMDSGSQDGQDGQPNEQSEGDQPEHQNQY